MGYLCIRSYRFNDMFPHAIQVREAQKQLDELIQIGLQHIAKLLKNTNLSNSEIPIPSIVETGNKVTITYHYLLADLQKFYFLFFQTKVG